MEPMEEISTDLSNALYFAIEEKLTRMVKSLVKAYGVDEELALLRIIAHAELRLEVHEDQTNEAVNEALNRDFAAFAHGLLNQALNESSGS